MYNVSRSLLSNCYLIKKNLNMKRKRHTVCTKFKTRREVALLCFSEKSPSNAVNCLRRWINSDPELLVNLEKANYHPHSRYLSPQQVRVLRRFLF